jgi:hypothetical protein
MALPRRDPRRLSWLEDGRVEAYYTRRGEERPEAQPSAEEILASFPPVEGLVFGSTACGGSRSVGRLIEQIADSAAQREWRSMGARSLMDARAYFVARMRRQMSFTAAISHARMRLRRLESIGHAGRTAGRRACSRAGLLASATAFDMGRGAVITRGGGT